MLGGACFSNMEENNGVRDNEQGPPVKVISKWKAPSKIINRIIVCHFAPKIGRLHVSRPLPVISYLFLTGPPLSYTGHFNGNRQPLRFHL